MRYERCVRCQHALDVEVVVDSSTRHYRIQPGICPRCSRTH